MIIKPTYGYITENGRAYGQIEIENDYIVAIGKELGKPIKIRGVAFPGFIDIHHHLRHNQPEKERPRNAARAIINGGVTAVLDNPNHPYPPIDKESFERKKCTYKKRYEKYNLDVLISALVQPRSKPFDEARFYKLFTTDFENLEELRETLKHYEGRKIFVHCEDPNIIKKYRKKNTHEHRRPFQAEINSIRDIIKCAQEYKLIVHIYHVTTSKGLEEVCTAKKSGLKITCGVTPHHLTFVKQHRYGMLSEDELSGSLLVTNPPLRNNDNRKALEIGLKNGVIDVIESDHAPHTLDDKLEGVPGVKNIEIFPLFAAQLLTQGVSYERIAELFSLNPARILELEEYGTIEVGKKARLTIIDTNKPFIFKDSYLQSLHMFSPYHDFKFPGRLSALIIGERIHRPSYSNSSI